MQKTVVRVMALLLVVLMCLTLLPIRSWAEEPCTHPGLTEDGWTVTQNPTCTAPGKKTQYCSACDTTVEQSIPVDPSAHNYVDIAGKSPTCGSAGYTAYQICTLCSHIEGKTDIPATGEHNWVEDSALAHVATAADCTHPASYYKVCSVCGAVSDSYTFESGNPLGHDMQPVPAVAARCDVPGHEAYEECTRCHITNPETPATIAALEHQWGEWTATSSLSCTTPRVEERTCTREGCGQKERREIPAPGHNFFNNVCTNPGCGATRASIKVTVNGDAIAKMADKPITTDQEIFVEPGTINIDILPATGNEVKSASINGTATSLTGNRISVPVEAGTPCKNIVVTVSTVNAPVTQKTLGEPLITGSLNATAKQAAVDRRNIIAKRDNISDPSTIKYVIYDVIPRWNDGTYLTPDELSALTQNISFTLDAPAGTSTGYTYEMYHLEGGSFNWVADSRTFSTKNFSDYALFAIPTSVILVVDPAAKTAQTAPAVYALDFLDDAGGAITGTTTDMLYREKGSSTFAYCKAGSTPVLHPGVYYVHYPETATSKASAETEVVIRSYYTVTAKHLYGKGTYYTDRPKLSGYDNVFVVPSGETISFTFTPSGNYWLHEINKNGKYVGYENVKRVYTTKIVDKTVVSFGFSSSSSSPKTADPNQDALTWGIAEIVSLIGMTTITWYLFRKKEY